MAQTELDRFDAAEFTAEAAAEAAAVEEGMVTVDAEMAHEEQQRQLHQAAAEAKAIEKERRRQRNKKGRGEKAEDADDTDDDVPKQPSVSASLPLSRPERLEAFANAHRAARAADRQRRRSALQSSLNARLAAQKEARLTALEAAWERRRIDNNRHEFGVGTAIDWATDFIGVERDDVVPYVTGMNWPMDSSGLLGASVGGGGGRTGGGDGNIASSSSSNSPPPDGRSLQQVTARRRLMSRTLPVAGSFFSFFLPPQHYSHYSDADRAVLKMRLYGLLSDVCGPLAARPIDIYDERAYEEAFQRERREEEAMAAAALAEMALERLNAEASVAAMMAEAAEL